MHIPPPVTSPQIVIPDKQPQKKIKEAIVSLAVNTDSPSKKSVGPEVLEGLYNIIKTYDWNASVAYAIMICESGGQFDAHNFSNITKDDSWGTFQINLYGKLAKSRPSPEWLKIPENNIAYAYKMYKSEGFVPWSCYKK